MNMSNLILDTSNVDAFLVAEVGWGRIGTRDDKRNDLCKVRVQFTHTNTDAPIHRNTDFLMEIRVKILNRGWLVLICGDLLIIRNQLLTWGSLKRGRPSLRLID